MRIFIDTNVFIATLTAEDGKDGFAKEVLNSNHTLCTSTLNLIEIRTVLTKKKRQDQDRVEEAIQAICEEIDIVVENVPSLVDINEFHKDTLLDPMDCLIFATSNAHDAHPVSFDGEMIHHGALDPSNGAL